MFYEDVSRFGGVYRRETIRENGVIAVRFSSVYSRALERRGLISGDKAAQNEGLHDWLKNDPELAPKYLSPMWAQDGCFPVCRDRKATFEWERGVVLRDQSKESIYGVEPMVTDKHAQFVREYGERKTSDKFGVTYQVTKGRLEELTENSNRRIAEVAEEILKIAQGNPPRLLVDEIVLLKNLGIKSNKYLSGLTYYESSQRLSALWHANTATKYDAMRVALKCAPEDVVKKLKVEDWVEKNPALKERVERDIENERRKNV
jgi:hypothetical protein